MTAKPKAPDPAAVHPLFPPEEGKPYPEIGSIHVKRWEGNGFAWHPRAFAPDELVGLEQIAAEWGGGLYELVARDSRNARITTQVRYKLPGAPKPLVAEPAVSAPAPSGGGGGGLDAVLVAMMQMMQQSSAQNAQLMMGMMQQQAAMMTAMVQASKGDASGMVAAMKELAASQMNANAQMVSAMAQHKAGGGAGDSTEAILTGLEIGREMAASKGSGEGDALETLGALAAGFMQGQGATGGGGGPAAPPPEGAH